ncbi:hypothetical protein NE464_21285, partial [Eubacterium callanderi]
PRSFRFKFERNDLGESKSISRKDCSHFDRIPSPSSARSVGETDFNYNREPSEDTLRYPDSIIEVTNRTSPAPNSILSRSGQFVNSNDLSDGFSTSNTINNVGLNANEKIFFNALQSMEKENLMLWKTSRKYGTYLDERRKSADA